MVEARYEINGGNMHPLLVSLFYYEDDSINADSLRMLFLELGRPFRLLPHHHYDTRQVPLEALDASLEASIYIDC